MFERAGMHACLGQWLVPRCVKRVPDSSLVLGLEDGTSGEQLIPTGLFSGPQDLEPGITLASPVGADRRALRGAKE
jgi:hypothetical protein